RAVGRPAVGPQPPSAGTTDTDPQGTVQVAEAHSSTALKSDCPVAWFELHWLLHVMSVLGHAWMQSRRVLHSGAFSHLRTVPQQRSRVQMSHWRTRWTGPMSLHSLFAGVVKLAS